MNLPKKIIRNFIFAISVLIFFCFVISCKDDIIDIGAEMLPDGDKYALKDIVFENILSKTIDKKSVITFGSSVKCLGNFTDTMILSNSDEAYSTSKCSYFCKFDIPYKLGNINHFHDIVSIDFSIYNEGFYGDTLNEFWIDVFQVDNFIDDSSLSDVYVNKGKQIGAFSSEKITGPNRFEISIYDTNFFKNIILDDDSLLFDQEKFNSAFKGLYLETTLGYNSGAVFLREDFDMETLIGTDAYIRIVYRNDLFSITETNDTVYNKTDTLNFITLRNIGIYEHNYNNAFKQSINTSLTSDSLFYVQSLGGVKGKITLPDLSYLRDSAINLNTAKIEVPVYYVSDRDTNMVLQLATMNADSSFTSIRKLKEGEYNKQEKIYTFYITLLINDFLINNSVMSELYIKPNQATELSRPGLWLFENSNIKPIKLTLLYNKFK